MKLTNLTSAAAALAFAALLGTSAHAAVGSSGDLIIGFDQVGATDNYEVDLGPVSQFLNPLATTENFTLSDTDLAKYFGSSWATVTTDAGNNTNAVQWGLIGANTGNGTLTLNGSSVTANTLFISWNTWATAPSESATPTNSVGDVRSFYVDTVPHPATGSAGALAGTFSVASSDTAGFDKDISTKSNFNLGSVYTKSILDYNSDGTLSPADALTLDLYELVPTGGAEKGQLLGTFTIADNGTNAVLTFTEAPEPSTYLLMGIGGLVVVWRLRRNVSVA